MIRPKTVFVPHETLASGMVVRPDDMPWFEDIDLVKQYLFVDLKGAPNRRLDWIESDNPHDIDEYMARKGAGKVIH